MSQLSSQLHQMADAGARQARPLAAAEIIRQGDHRRRRSRTRRSLGGVSVAGVAAAGVALGLGLADSAPAHGPGTIQTAAFTLVSNANGTTTLTVNAKVLLEPGALQDDLAKDGIPAMVTVGRFCHSSPAPADVMRVISIQKIRPGELPPSSPPGTKPRHLPNRTLTINPAAMPAGTELSFGNFRLGNGEETLFALINRNSYTCTGTAPAVPPPGAEGMSLTLAPPASAPASFGGGRSIVTAGHGSQ